MEEERVEWEMSLPQSSANRLLFETFPSSQSSSYGLDFEKALEEDWNFGLRRDMCWGGWEARTDLKVNTSSSVKKRNARDADLIEFQEVGTNPEDVEIGFNGAKIRTLDFDDADKILKDGYVVEEETLESLETIVKADEDEWLPSKSSTAGDLDFLWLDKPEDEEMTEWIPRKQFPCDRRIKVGKRRVTLIPNEVDENEGTHYLTSWQEIFETTSFETDNKAH